MRHRLPLLSLAPWALRVAIVAAAIGLSACGGGGGGGSAADGPPSSGGTPPPATPPPTTPPPANPPVTGTGTVRVKVTDAFGEAVAGANFYVGGTSFAASVRTDAGGTAQIADVPAGEVRVGAYHTVRGSSLGYRVTLAKDQVLELSRQLEINSDVPVATVLQARVADGGLSADGRQLDVVLRIAVTAARPGFSWFDDYYQTGVHECEARSGADLADLGPRCIHGIDGRDLSYSFGEVQDLGVVRAVEGVPQSWAVGLLIDQSDAGLSPDLLPNDPRLFAAKTLAHSLLPGTGLALAGFASDEPSGSASSLPQRPVTFFPVESPGFLGSWAAAYAVLQDLSGLVGGGTPLYAAIAAGIEFMAANAPAGRQRALVVLADGADSTCGSPAQCAQQRRAIVRRAREAGVNLFLAGASCEDPSWYCWTQNAKAPITELAVEGGIPLAVAADPSFTVGTLELARQWLAGSQMVQDVRVRLTSETAGAFAHGVVVTGTFGGVNPELCPFDCYVFALPFRVEIPLWPPN